MAHAERRWRLWLWLEAAGLLALVAFISPDNFASAQCPASCTCRDLSSIPGDDRIGLDCNSQSIAEVMAAVRASVTLRRNIDSLSFVNGSDTELPTDTFIGLPRLRTIEIAFFNRFRTIQPGAFNSLSNLIALDLRGNNLQWLSGDSFTGIGSNLLTLKIGNNPLRSLRSDLESLFAGVTSSIIMENMAQLVCDCHLEWLPNFISTTRSTRPQFSIDIDGSVCSDQGGLSITSDSVDFSVCRDICSLGYHNCHPNATCTVVRETSTSCACNIGFVGDGFNCSATHFDICNGVVCSPNAVCEVINEIERCVCKPGFVGDGSTCGRIDPCDLVRCDPNAVCTAGGDNGRTAMCMCSIGFTGDGSVCAPLEACNATCLTIQADLRCVVLREVIECTSERVQQLFETLANLEDNPTRSGVAMFTQRLMNISSNLTYAGDVLQIGHLLFGSVELLAQNPSLYQQSSYMNLVTVASDLLDIDNIQLWLDLNQTTAAEHIVELFSALEMLGQALFLQDPEQTDTSVVGDNIAIVVMRPDCESRNQSIEISSNTLDPTSQNGESTLLLPVSVFGDSLEEDCRDVGVIAIVYGGAGPDLISLQDEFIPKSNCTPSPAPKAHGQCEWYPEEPCPELAVNSIIISAVAVKSSRNRTGVDELNTTALTEPIVITLQHKDATHVGPSCAFLNEQEVQMGNGRWLTEGCRVDENRSDSDTTVCECSHLTSFAILTSPAGPPPPNFALSVVSKIGLSISILCLTITIVLLFALRIRESKLHHIHRQLAIALCLAQLVFLIGVDRILVPSPDALCTTIAALLHYLFLSTFAWQLVEGVHLYLFIVRVFFNKKIVYAYYPLAWGIPLIVVAITLGIRFCDYGSQYTCWITNGNGTNWAFHGPVIAVILVNIVVMVMVMYVILRARKKKNDDTFLFCTLLHSSFVLLPILGITWVLGFFVIGDNVASEVVEWLFCLLNSIQGMMLFIVHCLMSRDVRTAFLKAIGCHEAAKKQESVRTHIRRSSTVTSFTQFNMALKRTFSFTGKRRVSASDITSMPLNDSSHSGLGVFGIVAEPSLNGNKTNNNQNLIGMTNPGFQMEDIEEEGSSIGSSLPGTPQLSVAAAAQEKRPLQNASPANKKQTSAQVQQKAAAAAVVTQGRYNIHVLDLQNETTSDNEGT